MGRPARMVVVFETVGFGIVLAVLWLDEIFDLPHAWWGAPATPINWIESLFESVLVLLLGGGVILLTRWFLRRIRFLEGFLPICAGCKRIRAGTRWTPIEEYVRDHSEADFTHGLCPECLEKHYGTGAGRSK